MGHVAAVLRVREATTEDEAPRWRAYLTVVDEDEPETPLRPLVEGPTQVVNG
jgi:hypothetical protein